MVMSESRQKALNVAKDDFSYLSGNLLFQKWRTEAIRSFAFYDGHGQYDPNILEILHQRGQAPIVVNKVRSMVNQASGMEINTRGKIAFRPHSFNENRALLTKAMTHFGFAVQENQQYSYKGSLRCRDALICGLGWSRTDILDNQIEYSYIHPLNVLFDADDFTPQLTNQQKLIVMHWYPPEQLKAEYPKHAKEIDSISSNSPSNSGNFTSEFFNRNSSFLPSSGSGTYNGSRLQVNECFRKIKKKYYCGFDQSGYYFETFDEDHAEKIADKKSDIQEKWGTQVIRTVYCEDILLYYGPLFPNLPNKDFPIIPCVWLRRTSDAVMVGWIKDFEDLQREANYRKLKEIMSLNSVRAIVDSSALDGMTADEIREELSRQDSVLFTTGDGSVEIIQNHDITNAMLKASERIDYELQQVSGMYSDALGDATNAQSGIAIKRRQVASSRNLAFGFDSFIHAKEREGRLLLDLIQGSALENIRIDVVLDDDEKQSFIMNLVREEDGHVFNDISTIPVDVYVEIVPDYDSSLDEQKATLEALLANPQAPLILQNPFLLKILMGERHADKIASAMQQLNEQQMQQQAIARGDGMPPQMIQQEQDVNPIQAGSI